MTVKKKSTKGSLVIQHLEDASRDLLKDHRELIRDYIKGKHGIYALYKNDRLYYVGLASDLHRRVRHHLKGRLAGKWNSFSIYLVKDVKHIKELESLVLRIVQPKGNQQKGKFKNSQNLKPQIKKAWKKKSKKIGEGLLEKKKRTPRSKTTTKKKNTKTTVKEAVLAKIVKKRGGFPIRAEYKGKTYKARVLKSGWISYKKYRYRSPSGLAEEICGRNKNGWTFWKFRNKYGEWVQLKQLR